MRTGVQIDRALNRDVFAAVFRHTVQAPGGNSSQALRDIDTLREFLTGPGLLAFCDAPWVPLFLGICFVMHPLIGLVALCGAIIIFCLALTNNLMTRGLLKEATSRSVAANHFVSGSLRNAEALQAMGMLGHFWIAGSRNIGLSLPIRKLQMRHRCCWQSLKPSDWHCKQPFLGLEPGLLSRMKSVPG